MALELDSRYPGRFNPGDADYPQGSFKNRTAPGALDGSYLEKDWANDKEGFFQRLMLVAGISPNGVADTALSSQYYDALLQVISDEASIPGGLLGSGIRSAYSNLSASAPGTNATFSFSADAICVKNASNEQIVLNNVSESCNLLTSGAGGLDTGVIAGNTWYAGYIAFNPATLDSYAVASLNFTAPVLQPGYTHYAFVTSARTNAGATQLLPFTRDDDTLFYAPGAGTPLASDFPIVLNAGTATTATAVSLQLTVPPSAKEAILGLTVTGTTSTIGFVYRGAAGTASGLLGQCINNGAGTQRFQIIAPRPYASGVHYALTSPGTASIYVMGYKE